MAIQVKIGTHTPAEKNNEYVAVIDALLGAVTDENPQPNATFSVPADKAGSIKRQMREAAHLRDKTARLTEEEPLPVKKGEEPEISLTYILTDRITRTAGDEDEAADENADA